MPTSVSQKPSILSKIDHQSLKGAAVEQIQAAILRGELKPGERVTELGLARKLGVSQPTIREALIELEHQGFIQRGNLRKTYVTVLCRRDVDEIYLLRSRLESLAVELVASQKEKKLAACKVAHQRLVAAAKQGRVSELYQADLDFHRELWRATGNRNLVDTLERLVPKIFAFGIMQRIERSTPNLQQSAQEHGRLLRLIEQGQLKAAKAIMEESMRQAHADDVKGLDEADLRP